MIAALSDNVSTTLKFSIVAKNEKRASERYSEVVSNIRTCYSWQWLRVRGRTLPVVAVRRVPEVVADLVTRHPLHRVGRLQRVQNDPVFLHLSPVHLRAHTHTHTHTSWSRHRCLQLWLRSKRTQQILLVPSSLLPLRPAASWRLRRRPAASRSCDSAPSPPPVTWVDGRQRMWYWLCDDNLKKVLRHQHGVTEWMWAENRLWTGLNVLIKLGWHVFHNRTTRRWIYSHQQRWRNVWNHTVDRIISSSGADELFDPQHKFMHQELQAAKTQRENKQVATETLRQS